MKPSPQTLARLDISTGLRTTATVVLGLIGGALIARAFGGGAWSTEQILSVLGALLAFAAMRRIHARTPAGIVLTSDALWDTDGVLIARLEDIASVNRGRFAFKPPNGFTLRLHAPARALWAPGIYWRYGRTLGIGGMTPLHPAKAMATAIEAALAARETK